MQLFLYDVVCISLIFFRGIFIPYELHTVIPLHPWIVICLYFNTAIFINADLALLYIYNYPSDTISLTYTHNEYTPNQTKYLGIIVIY